MARIGTFLVLAISVGCAFSKSTYIKGGSDSKPGAWPWQGSIQYMFGQLHECGAAILSDKFILTAAHCVHNSPFARHLIAGLYNTKDWSQGNPTGKQHFYGVYWHDDHVGFNNDIAVVELHTPYLNMSNPFVGKIDLAPKGANYEGQECVITGWGATRSGSTEVSGPLQQAKVVVLTQQECKAQWGDVITDGMICVGGGGNIGACKGDSGSPLMCQGDNGWELVGVASFGPNDCDASKPSVYTSVPYYWDWIKSKIDF